MMRRVMWLAMLMVALLASTARAHEAQPASVDIKQLGPDRYQVTSLFPDYTGQYSQPRVEFPATWKMEGEPTFEALRDCTVRWQVVRVPGGTVEGAEIKLPGLEATVTNVWVRVTRSDGSTFTALATPVSPQVVLRGERPWYAAAGEYVRLGIDHILTGVDHLLFVLGLLLIVRGRRKLLATITAFTIAHSITLAVATLGFAHAPLNPLNAAIALSILFLGPEVARVEQGETSFTIRNPWVVAFAFGLLHGFGFATGLATNGMPRAEIPISLLFFNVGVEIGQLFFVGMILLLARSFRTLEIRWPEWAKRIPQYAVGGLGAYWTIARTVILIGAMG